MFRLICRKVAMAGVISLLVVCTGGAFPVGVAISAGGSSANTATIFVNAAAPSAGTGGATRPYQTIGQALGAARAKPAQVKVQIHVAAGEYASEVWPLRVDRPNVSLIGETVFKRDARGLAAAIRPGTATNLIVPGSYDFAGDSPHMVVVTADDVTVRGLVMINHVVPSAFGSSLIQVDGTSTPAGDIASFRITDNWLVGTVPDGYYVQFGVATYEASGFAEGNVTSRFHTGFLFSGGTKGPSVITFDRNRSSISDYLAEVWGPSNTGSSDPAAIQFEAWGNEADHNSFRELPTVPGIPFFGGGLAFFIGDNSGQAATTTANVHDNWFRGDSYGIEVNTYPFAQPNCDAVVSSFHGVFAHNDLSGAFNHAIFTTGFWAYSVPPYYGFFCHLPNQSVVIDDQDGEFSGCFDWDVPPGLNDTVIVNGVQYAGAHVSPSEPASCQ